MVPLPGFGHICGQSLNMLKKIDFSRHKFECLQIQTDSPQLLIRRSGANEPARPAAADRILSSREGAWSVFRRRLPNRFTRGSGYKPDADPGTSRRRPSHGGKFYSSDGVRHIGGIDKPEGVDAFHTTFISLKQLRCTYADCAYNIFVPTW